MLKTGILHPQLARVLAELRHKDTIIIGDAGLPIPNGVERVDLGWTFCPRGFRWNIFPTQSLRSAAKMQRPLCLPVNLPGTPT